MLEDIRKIEEIKETINELGNGELKISNQAYIYDTEFLLLQLEKHKEVLEYYANDEYLKSIGYAEKAVSILEKE